MRPNDTYLIIDDDDIDKMIVQRMMQRVRPGLEQREMADGKEALSYLEDCLKERDVPRFILLDLVMPLWDGFMFLERYMERIYPSIPDVPIVILSSSVHGRDREKCLEYPFVKEYMLKPFSKDAFMELNIS